MLFRSVGLLLTSTLGGAGCAESDSPEDSGANFDASADAGNGMDAGPDVPSLDGGPGPDVPVDASVDVPIAPTVRGHYESTAALRTCGQLLDTWQAPDGLLLKASMNLCGDDLAALSDTIVANLDAAEARGGRVLLILNHGVNLPAAWISACENFTLTSGRFSGESCLPWDETYQDNLRSFLGEQLGPAVAGHPGLEAVYFVIVDMADRKSVV